MTRELKNQVIDNFLHKLANQLANANNVEERERVLNNARIWLDVNFTLKCLKRINQLINSSKF